MKHFLHSLCIAALITCTTPARADLQLTFQVSQKTEKPAPEPEKNPPTLSSREFTLTVTLGEDYLTSTSPEKTVAHDFTAKRSYWLEEPEKTYHEQSLYADVGFREAELRNRLMLQNVLKAGEIKQNPFDTVLMEHLFALRSPESKPLTPDKESQDLRYSHGEQPLFSATDKGHPLTAEETKQFIRFLRHAYPAHPDILAALEKQNAVPAEFELHQYNMGADHFRFTLVKSVTVPKTFDPSALVAGFKRSESEVRPICALADAITPEDFQTKCDELVRAAVVEGKEKRYLECLLLFLEYALSSGQQLPREFQTFRTDLQADPNVNTFLSSMNPKDKDSAQKAADVMKNLRSGASKGSAVLKIHEANNLTAAGKPHEAQELFKEALTESPWIVGAWKDLGDLYYGTYEMGTTWQCWDTGRRLHPTQKQFDPVRQFERKLLTDHPEFF
jgi:hypothetical protein